MIVQVTGKCHCAPCSSSSAVLYGNSMLDKGQQGRGDYLTMVLLLVATEFTGFDQCHLLSKSRPHT